MHIEFLVEELSAEITLLNLLPKLFGEGITYNIITFQGKNDLLAKLPNRLLGYSYWIPDDYRIVVLVDEDRQDCLVLKADLERYAVQTGFSTKSNPGIDGSFVVLNRIAIEELEAWFFGDVEAMCQAFPRLNPNLGKQANYRHPDQITGGTWERLERLLQLKGYYRAGMPKTEVADKVSQFMVPENNRSPSFKVFLEGLASLQHNA